ncbi:peptidoglycan DD-metalloendopeptidase family protein [uncultured Acetobacteroides sp.]|uniref:murein hydrolase activator EnvC family protein n=1 Tax=uncultured Acetobacteroides sp. TaxID=1760811 RepID=UPI0029F5C98D|nr:peptidoglycan DD-metalloendopeptidase family protein [uncultured Acetobacteroides sp.]
MYRLLLILLFLFSAQITFSQSLKELQDQKRIADREINKINEQLSATMLEKNSTLKQAALINSKIQKRKKLIDNIDKQVIIVTKNIQVKTDTVYCLRLDIDTLKVSYANTLKHAYKMRNSNSVVALVFASSDLHQAIRRMKYLRSYSNFRIQQAKSIEQKQQILNVEIVDLNSKKRSLEVLLADKNKEIRKLDQDEKAYEKMAAQLKSKEKDLTKEIQIRKNLSDRLSREISRLIAEEARKAAEAARKAAARKAAAEAARLAKRSGREKENRSRISSKSGESSDAKTLPFTPEDRMIAGRFESNRGRLPWPVRQGEVVEGFGMHQHPFLKGVRTENKGVDISSNAGTDVYAVYDGEVSKIFTLPGANWSVLVRHGYYITVYSNLSHVNVKEGQSIKAKQILGVLANSDMGGEKPTLKFQVWKEMTPQNPMMWLTR